MSIQTLLRPLQFTAVVIALAGLANASSSQAKKPAATKTTVTTSKKTAKKATTQRKTTATKNTAVRKKTTAQKKTAVRKKATTSKKTTARRRSYSPWTVPTYAPSTIGDQVDGEDLAVRRAAVEALGPYNGTIVAVDSMTGRILTMVNQKRALTAAFEPCSTVKIAVALAALGEGIIGPKNRYRLTSSSRAMDLTEALARSNNPYFANLGLKLGYDRFSYYAQLFGFGERAGLNIEGESAGLFSKAPPKSGGMGRMTSFGTGIQLTALQLAAFMSAVSNGGTLYYLQYPTSQEEVDAFVPRVKRYLDITEWIPAITPGLTGAVKWGTARAAYDPEYPICGKTGTCTDGTTHLGWFGSFTNFGQNDMVVVVLMTGAEGVSGPTAAQIAGDMYRRLRHENYFASERRLFSPAVMVPR